MKKAIIALILLGAAGGGGYWFYSQSKKPDPPTINYATVSRGNIVDTVTATGQLEPVERVDVGSQVSGVILELSADFNDVVRKGQLLAKLDPKLIDTQILQAEANLTRSETDVARNRVQLEDAERKYARTKELYEKGIQNRVDFENADLQLKSANAALQSSLASLKQSSANLEQQRVNREHTEIYSPIDGIVVARRVDVGQTVNAGQQAPILYNLAADLAEMRVIAGIDEADIGRVRADQNVTFRIDAYQNEVFTGTVQSVRLEARMQQNVVTYQAVITVPNPGLKLRPGMTANINIEIARKNDVIRVPNAATRFRPTSEMYVALGLEPPDMGRGRGGPGREGGRGGDLTAAAGAPGAPGQPTAVPAGAPQSGSGQEGSASGRQSGERREGGQSGQRGGRGGGFGNGENGADDFAARMRNMTPEEREKMMSSRGGRGGSGRGGSGRGGSGRDGGGRGRGREGMNAREGRGNQGGQRGGSTLTAAELAATRGVTTIDKLFPPLPSAERPGRVWTLKKEGEKNVLNSHNVRLGISDGTVTELVEGDVTEGQQLITTIVTAQVRPTPGMFGPQGGNPFMQQPGRGGPGGGRGPGGGGGGGPQGGGGGGGGGGGRGGGGGGGRGGGGGNN
jgi:HlyD family secretion protein